VHGRLAVVPQRPGDHLSHVPQVSSLNELYLLDRGAASVVLGVGRDGFPSLFEPQPLLYRAAELSQLDFDMQGEMALNRARGQLASGRAFLLPVPCPDGPPYRSFLYFTFQGTATGVSWHDGPHIRNGYSMQVYRATTDQAPYTWISDARQGNPGYFVTGPAGQDSLWRILRIESDALHRVVFTLAPVRWNARCPAVDFSKVPNVALATELQQQYDDLCRSVTNSAYRDIATKARNIAEGAISARLAETGQQSSGRLFEDLQSVQKLLSDSQTRNCCGFRDIDYHLAQKIRLVHGRTHAAQVGVSGPFLRPEFALTVVEDLIELLKGLGYCHG
jgi:hypothetical protein